jgi:hypothetical protein
MLQRKTVVYFFSMNVLRRLPFLPESTLSRSLRPDLGLVNATKFCKASGVGEVMKIPPSISFVQAFALSCLQATNQNWRLHSIRQ